MNKQYLGTLLGCILLWAPLTALAATQSAEPAAAPEQVVVEPPVLPAPISVEEQQEVEAEMATASIPEENDPGMLLDDLINDYNTNGPGRMFSQKKAQGKLYYTVASAVVKVKASNPDWPGYRVMAFKEAFLTAQAEYMQFLGVTVKTSALKTMAEDPEFPKFTPEEVGNISKFEALLEKGIAILEGKMDNMLTDLGVDPQKFAQLPKSKQKDLLRQSIEQKAMRTARAELTGMIPIQTFEAQNDSGDHMVAVAVVASHKFKGFVDEVLKSKGEMTPNPKKVGGPTVAEQIILGKEQLVDQFGIRRIYDENGYPVLVSYGQSFNPYKGSDYQSRLEERDVALQHAAAESYANFAFLFNSNGMFKEEESKKATSKKTGTVELDADGNSFESTERSKEYLRKLNQTVESRGHVNNLPGVQKVHKWIYKHPQYGHEICGVIYTWSPQGEGLARKLRTGGTSAKKQAEHKTAVKGHRGARTGQQLMNVDDF